MQSRRLPWHKPRYGVVPIVTLVAGTVLSAVAACSNSAETSELHAVTLSPTRTTPATPTASLQASSEGQRGTATTGPAETDDFDTADGPTVLPFSALSPEAAAYAETLACCLAAAVVVADGGVAYGFQEDEEYPWLSIAKIPIMLTYLDKVLDEGRTLSTSETALFESMITRSDNGAANELWFSMGGASAVTDFLASIGVAPADTIQDNWGSTQSSPLYTASLLSMLVESEILNDDYRSLAMGLMASVEDGQRWGALAGISAETHAGIKNGWFHDDDGWILNSVAYVEPESGPSYAIAIFSWGWANMATGISVIEHLAAVVNSELAIGQ